MGSRVKSPPKFTTVTFKCRYKARCVCIEDSSIIEAMVSSGRRFAGEARAQAGFKDAAFAGIFLLPTNNVMELYKAKGSHPVAIVFSGLDVWLSFAPDDLAMPV